jgi:hypothetical protein
MTRTDPPVLHQISPAPRPIPTRTQRRHQDAQRRKGQTRVMDQAARKTRLHANRTRPRHRRGNRKTTTPIGSLTRMSSAEHLELRSLWRFLAQRAFGTRAQTQDTKHLRQLLKPSHHHKRHQPRPLQYHPCPQQVGSLSQILVRSGHQIISLGPQTPAT